MLNVLKCVLDVEGVGDEVGEAHQGVGGAADGWGLLLRWMTVTIPASLSRVMREHAEVPMVASALPSNPSSSSSSGS